MRTPALHLALALAPWLLLGCDPTYFADVADERAALRVYSIPKPVRKEFGAFYGTKVTASDDGERSRFYVGDTRYATFSVFEGWLDGGLSLDNVKFTCDFDPSSGVACDRDAEGHTGFAGVDTYRGDKLCAVTATGDENQPFGIDCVTQTSFGTIPFEDITDDDADLGYAFASLPSFEGFVASSPDAERLLLVGTSDAGGGDFKSVLSFDDVVGKALASIVGVGDDEDATWIAATFGDDQVVVGKLAYDEGSSTVLLACQSVIEESDVTSLALAFVDDDALPEVFMGTARGVSAAKIACADDTVEPATIACDELVDGKVEGACTGEDPAAVVMADVNGDGAHELVVGLAATEVRGTKKAGAVFVLPVSADGDDVDFAVDEAKGTADSDPEAGLKLGASVAALRAFPEVDGEVVPRHEIVAGAPGEASVFVLLCTGFEGDKPGDGLSDRCQ